MSESSDALKWSLTFVGRGQLAANVWALPSGSGVAQAGPRTLTAAAPRISARCARVFTVRARTAASRSSTRMPAQAPPRALMIQSRHSVSERRSAPFAIRFNHSAQDQSQVPRPHRAADVHDAREIVEEGMSAIVFLAVAPGVDIAQRVAELVRRHREVGPLNLVLPVVRCAIVCPRSDGRLSDGRPESCVCGSTSLRRASHPFADRAGAPPATRPSTIRKPGSPAFVRPAERFEVGRRRSLPRCRTGPAFESLARSVGSN